MTKLLKFSPILCAFFITQNVWGQVDMDFLRADADDNGTVTTADADFIYAYVWEGGPAPNCKDAADANDDGLIDNTDYVFILTYILLGGAPPPDPGPTNCGDDPTSDYLNCAESQCS